MAAIFLENNINLVFLYKTGQQQNCRYENWYDITVQLFR
jgi:hypothetical protein